MLVTWTPSTGGTLELQRAEHPPTWRRGTVIPTEQMHAHGTSEPLTAAVPTADGRLRLDLPCPDDPVHLTAFLRTPVGAIVGATVALSGAAPVRNLTARRFQREARLSWVWPDGATAVVAQWYPDPRPGAPPPPEGGPQRCSRRAFFDGGGLTVPVGYGAVTIEIRASYGYEASPLLAPPVQVRVEAMVVAVRYEIRDPRWSLGSLRRGGRRCEVLLTAEVACDLPDVVVVEGRDRKHPEAADRGAIVGRLPARPVEAGESVALPVDLPDPGPSWLVCLVDPGADPDGTDEIRLEHPPTSQLWRR